MDDAEIVKRLRKTPLYEGSGEESDLPEYAADAIERLTAPVPMLLWCPRCGYQHIDEPNPERGWTNPPHRSHECQACRCIWRPADVATTGVAAIATEGAADNWPQSTTEVVALSSLPSPVCGTCGGTGCDEGGHTLTPETRRG